MECEHTVCRCKGLGLCPLKILLSSASLILQSFKRRTFSCLVRLVQFLYRQENRRYCLSLLPAIRTRRLTTGVRVQRPLL